MAKKKEMKQIFENLELESSEANPNSSEPHQEPAQPSETPVGDEEKLEERLLSEGQQVELKKTAGEEQAAIQGIVPETGPRSLEPPKPEPREDNPDDLLEDVRRLLLEEETEDHKDTKWWQRFGKSSRRKSEEEEAPKVPEEINLPTLSALQTTETEGEAVPDPGTGEYQEQLDELLGLLDTKEEPVEQESAVVLHGADIHPEPETAPEPEKPIALEDLKKQAFQSRPAEAGQENATDVRSIAFEGEEEVFVEVESKSPDQLDERLSAVENALKPHQRTINLAFAFLGIVMAAVAVFLLYNAYQRSMVQARPTPIPSDVPYPTTVGLPGGWQFALGRGSLTADGSWNPSGAEWLQGTEICRWVALPYSRQLEAVVRTLNANDPIELGMSNHDKLTYNVYSVQQMSPAELLKTDSNKPCLLIVLAEPNAAKRWVLTALP
jgi:hypothetical protein